MLKIQIQVTFLKCYWRQNQQFSLKARPPNSIEVDVVVVVAKEEQGEPGLESVNRDDEQDPDNPALLRRVRVVPGGMRCTMRTSREKYVAQARAMWCQ